MVFLVNRTSMVNFQVKSDETLKNFKSMRQSFLWTNGLMRGGGAQDLRKQQIYIINQCLDLLHTGIKSAVKPDTFMSEEVQSPHTLKLLYLRKHIFIFSGCMSPLHQHQVCSFFFFFILKGLSGRIRIGLGKYINCCGLLTYLFE